MADGRMLKKRIAHSRKFSALKSDTARMIYLLIIPHLDCEGRIEADPILLMSKAFPLLGKSSGAVQLCLNDLNDVGLIKLYVINNEQYLQLTRFEDFNRIDKGKEAKSIIPPNSGVTPENSGVTPENSSISLSEVKVKYNIKHSEPSYVKTAREYFSEVFKKKFGSEYISSFAKDGKILKGLEPIIKIDDLKKLIDKFFRIEDEFVKTTGRTIGVFHTQINKLRVMEDDNAKFFRDRR